MAVALVGRGVGPEDVAEVGGVVAEEFFVEGPVRVFGSDVDVDDVVREESGERRWVVRGWIFGMWGGWIRDGLHTR